MAVRRITTLQGPTLKADDGTTAATIADSTGAISIGSGGTNWTLPTARGTDKYVLQVANATGVATWVESLTAPEITGISGNLNAYEAPLTPTGTWNNASTAVTLSSGTSVVVGATVTGVGIANGTTVSAIAGTALTLSQNSTAAGEAGSPLVISKTAAETMGGTLTITGTSIGTNTAELTVVIQRSDGTKVTTASRINSAATTTCEAQWFGNETNYDTFGNSETIYVKVTKIGLASNVLSSNKIFTTDPNFTTELAITQSGGEVSVAPSDTVLGSYGSGAIAGGGSDANTKFLLNFDRGGGTDIEDSSNTSEDGYKATTYNQAIIKASPYGDGKSAMFFDGTDDQLTLTSHADFELDASTAFTIEGWIYVNSGNFATVLRTGATGASDGYHFGCIATSSTPRVSFSYGTDLTSLQDDVGLPLKTWTHIAVSREAGGLMRLFKDGRQIKSATSTAMFGTSGGSTSYIGLGYRSSTSTNDYQNGYLDEIRFVKGTAVYTSDFDVPTSRLTEITNTKLLIHSNRTDEGNTTFTDSATTGTTHTITASGGTIHSKLHGGIAPAITWPASGKTHGSSGVFFDGSGDYIKIPFSTNLQTTGNFTFDCWVNRSTQSGGNKVIDFGDASNYATNLAIYFDASGAADLTIYLQGVNATYDLGTSIAGTWYHFAAVRNGTNTKIYWDGVLKGTLASSGGEIAVGTPACYIGMHYNAGSNPYHGYMDVVRFSHIDRTAESDDPMYISSGTSFTPPTKIYGATGSLTPDVGTITITATPSTNATTGTLTSSATSVTSITTTNVRVGDRVTGTGIASGTTTVASITTEHASNGGTIVLSANSTASGSQTLTFTPEIAFSEQGSSLPTGISGNLVDGGAGANTATITGTMSGTAGTTNAVRIRMQANGDAARISEINESSGVGALQMTKNSSGAPDLFNARRWIGTGVDNKQITEFGFSPDMVWFKNRGGADSHAIYDSVRGPHQRVHPSTDAAASTMTGGVHSFDADGVTIGTNGQVGGSGYKMITWGWKAGGTPSGELVGSGATMSGTSGAGTIHNSATGVSNVNTLTQSVNQTTGFSITTYTGGINTQSGLATFPHNLGGTPDFVMIKNLGLIAVWPTWHSSLSTGAGLTDVKTLKINDTVAETNGINHGRYNSSASDRDTLITLVGGLYTDTTDYNRNVCHTSMTYVCYAWKAVAGVSVFGTYEGTNATNTVAAISDIGFVPRLVIAKNIDATGDWMMFNHILRGPAHGVSYTDATIKTLSANADQAESSGSNDGLKAYDTGGTKGFSLSAGGLSNVSGNTFIFAAFA